MSTFPKPDMVVYLHADDSTIKDRALKRDGLVAHDPHELQPYWDRLIADLEKRGIPVFRVNTGIREVRATQEVILEEVHRLKNPELAEVSDDTEGVYSYHSVRVEVTLPQ